MAFNVDFNYKGIEVKTAYACVSSPVISENKKTQSFLVLFSVGDSEPFSCAEYSSPYDLEGANPFVQAYEYLKALPEFEGAVDC